MTKDNFYVITGGPGAGKSTLIKSLNQHGYKFVDDTARRIIKERLRQGLSPRPEPIEFAKQTFEQDLKNYFANENEEGVIFFDRSFIDSAGMIYESDKHQYLKIKETLEKKRFNKNVFIAPPWKEIFCTDEERDQTFEHAVEVYEFLFKWYKRNNYNLIEIPKGSVDERTESIIMRISIVKGKLTRAHQ